MLIVGGVGLPPFLFEEVIPPRSGGVEFPICFFELGNWGESLGDVMSVLPPPLAGTEFPKICILELGGWRVLGWGELE